MNKNRLQVRTVQKLEKKLCLKNCNISEIKIFQKEISKSYTIQHKDLLMI